MQSLNWHLAANEEIHYFLERIARDQDGYCLLFAIESVGDEIAKVMIDGSE